MHIVRYLALGGVIGTVSGALGIGGGVLLVPALMWLCDFDYARAAGTSVGVLVLPVGLLAAWEAYHQNRVDAQASVCIAVTFTGGAYLGALLVPYIPKPTLLLCFGLLMLFIAVRFILASSPAAHATAVGMVAVVLAWLAYLVLHVVGRRRLAAPSLGDQIHHAAEKTPEGTDYYI